MLNRYDTPAQAEFINTYAPIPFEQLYTLGKAAGDRLDKAVAEYKAAKKEWGDFQSMSAIDNKNWDKVTMEDTGVRDLIDQAAANPDLIKDSKFQMALQAGINSADTSLMRNLRQSADNFKLLEAARQKLIQEGKYNEAWDLYKDVSQWDTLNPENGIFTHTTLTPYQSIDELVEPVAQNLHETDLGGEGFWLYKGITADALEDAVSSKFPEILNQPAAKEHIAAYQRSGMSYEDATNMFMGELINNARSRAYKNRYENKVAMMMYEQEAANARAIMGKKKTSGEDKPETILPDPYSRHTSSSAIQINRSMVSKNPYLAQIQAEINKYDQYDAELRHEADVFAQSYNEGKITAEQLSRGISDIKQRQAVLDKTKNDKMLAANKKYYQELTVTPGNKVGATNSDKFAYHGNAIGEMINMSSSAVAQGLVSNYYDTTFGKDKITLVTEDGENTGYKVRNFRNFVTDDVRVAKMIGESRLGNISFRYKDDSGHERDFYNELNKGSFGSAIFLPDNLSTYNSDGDLGLSGDILIDLNEVERRIGKKEMKNLKSHYESVYGKGCILPAGTLATKQYDSKANVAPNSLQGERLRIHVTDYIPQEGESRVFFDQAGNNAYGGTSVQKEQYESSLKHAYRNQLNNYLGQ